MKGETCPICADDLSDTGDSPIWLQCDHCGQWYHARCLKLTAAQVEEIVAYHCNKCAKSVGPSEYRRRLKRSKVNIDYVALNDGNVFAVDKSVHPHVHKFMEFEIDANKVDDTKNPYVDILDDSQLTYEYVTNISHLKRPILVPSADPDNVGMQLPALKNAITIDYVLDKVGHDTPVEVMDVLSQQGVSPGWKMKQWRDYFVKDGGSRDRIRNVISLEISQVEGFGKQFKRPQMVEDLDLIDKIWPNVEQDQFQEERPQVTKYCLMSVNGSFTDFHIDFGGTSVYYTVCNGAKTFLMIPPTEENLELYTAWCLEPEQNFIWFPEYVKKGKLKTPQGGFKVTLKPGDVFIIPSGWIHAVYTPSDSIVIGGNFLTLMDMRTQLRIHQIEKDTHVPMKFRHPQFNRVLWMAAWYYMNHEREFARDLGRGSDIKQEDSTNENIKQEPIDTVDYNNVKDTTRLNAKAAANAAATEYVSTAKLVIADLHAHLAAHYETSKTNQTAKRAIPTALIGKDIPKFLKSLHTWSQKF